LNILSSGIDQTTPQQMLNFMDDLSELSLGFDFSMMKKNNKTVWNWGINSV
jgi:hypothetical protein